MTPTPTAFIFDLGGVVLGWDPIGAFAQVLPATAVPEFLTRIDFHSWNRTNDGGRRFDEAERLLIEQFPDDADAIRAYRRHFTHSLTGMVPGTSAILAELAQAGARLSALTNWSDETFPVARERFGILRRFGEILVSGAEGLLKPDPAIFALAMERAGLDPAATVFVDDSPANVAAARSCGLIGITFTDAETLRSELVRLGVLGPRVTVDRPVFHLTTADLWDQARASGGYLWSSRGLTYEQEGFVHCSFAEQVDGIVSGYYGDVPATELVVLRLEPTDGLPIVVEDGFPHLFAPFPTTASVER